MKSLQILAIFCLFLASSKALSTISCVSELVSPNGKKIRIIGDSYFTSIFSNKKDSTPSAPDRQVEDFISHLEKQNDCMVLTQDRMYEYIKGIKNKEDRSFHQNQWHNKFLKNLTNQLCAKNIAAHNIDFRDTRLYMKEGDDIDMDHLYHMGSWPRTEYWNPETVNFHSNECKKVFDQIAPSIPSAFEQEFQNLQSTYGNHITAFSSLQTDDTTAMHKWGFEYFEFEKAMFDFHLLGTIHTNGQAHDSPSTTYLAIDVSHKRFLEESLEQLGYKQTYPVYAYTTKKVLDNEDAFREKDPIDMKKALDNMSNVVITQSAIQAA